MWGHIFQAITKLNVHQNELMWGRIKVLLIIEGFILTSAHTIRGSYLSPLLFVIGIFATIGIWHIFSRDKMYRNMYHDMLTEISQKHLDYDFSIKRPAGHTGTSIFKVLCLSLGIINYLMAVLSYIAATNKDFLKKLFGA